MRTGSKHIPQMLTPGELATLLKISRPSVYRLADKRIIPFHKVGGSLRFSEEDIWSFLEQNRFEPVGLK